MFALKSQMWEPHKQYQLDVVKTEVIVWFSPASRGDFIFQPFIIPLCVCVSACMCVRVNECVCICVYVRVHVHTRIWLSEVIVGVIFLNSSPPYFLRQSFSLNLELTDLLILAYQEVLLIWTSHLYVDYKHFSNWVSPVLVLVILCAL